MASRTSETNDGRLLPETNVPGQSRSWMSAFETGRGRCSISSASRSKALGESRTSGPAHHTCRRSASKVKSPNRIGTTRILTRWWTSRARRCSKSPALGWRSAHDPARGRGESVGEVIRNETGHCRSSAPITQLAAPDSQRIAPSSSAPPRRAGAARLLQPYRRHRRWPPR